MSVITRSLLLAATASFVLCQGAFAEAFVITVTPSLAPNAYGSPSFAQWQANAFTALKNGATSAGDPTSPTYYHAQSTVDASQTIVTGFPSWLGQVDPGTAFGAAYANEYGNRMTFGLSIVGQNGAQFSVSELGFDSSSNGSTLLTTGFGGAAGGWGPGTYGYSDGYIGVIFGTNGNPDQYITSGPDTQLVDALFSRGSGNSNAALCPNCSLADQQAAIQTAVDQMAGITQFTGTYYLSDNADGTNRFASGDGTFDITGTTPEPSTWILLLSTIPVVGVARRRSRRS